MLKILCVVVAESLSCVQLCDPINCRSPRSSVHGISQARILEWVAISFSRGSSRPRDWNCVSCIGWLQALSAYTGRHWAIRKILILCTLKKEDDLFGYRDWERSYTFIWEFPLTLPGKSHGQRSLVGRSPWGRKELDMTERLTLTYTYLLTPAS